MEAWRTVWRNVIVPQLSTAGLDALRKALLTDDARLIQGETAEGDDYAPGGRWCLNNPITRGCAIGFAGWQGGQMRTVEDAVDFMSDLGGRSDRFTDWFDNTPRAEVFRELLPEVCSELNRRAAIGGTA